MRSGWRDGLPVACLLLFAAVAGTLRLRAYDTFWHLAGGRWILAHRALPRLDPFRFTSYRVPWVDHEWLFQVAIAGMERMWGPASLVVGLTVLVVAVTVLLYRALRQSGAGAVPAVLVVLLAVLGARSRFFLRPELVSLAMLPLLLALLQHLRRTRSRTVLWLVPLLLVVWVSFHPGALLAPPVAAVYLAGARLPGGWGSPRRGDHPMELRWVAGLPAAAAAALFLNPYGARVFTVPFGIAAALRGLPGVNPEWLPLWRAPLPYVLLAMAALAVLAGVGLIRARRLDPATGGVALLLAGLAATAVRHQGLFFVGAAFFAGEILADLARLQSPPPRRSLATALAPLACLLAILWCLRPPAWGPLRPRQGTFQPGLGLEPGRFPETAVDALATRPDYGQIGPLYNDVAWGGYLLWRLYPPRQVFIDARNEVNPALFHQLAAARADERAWNAMLARYGIDGALVRYDERPRPVLAPATVPGRPPSIELHTANALFFPRDRFALVYWDDVAMLFLRRTPARAQQLAEEEYRFVQPEDWRATLRRAAEDPAFRAAVLADLDRRLRDDPTVVRAIRLRQALTSG